MTMGEKGQQDAVGDDDESDDDDDDGEDNATTNWRTTTITMKVATTRMIRRK